VVAHLDGDQPWLPKTFTARTLKQVVVFGLRFVQL
jgi:hypothetical protein